MNPHQPIPSLPAYILTHLEETCKEDEQTHDSSQPSRLTNRNDINSQSPLLRLPIEIMQKMTLYLDAASTFALRMTCAQTALSIPLDQRFWYIQLVNGGLFGFLFVFEVVDVLKEIHNRVVRRRKLPPHRDWKKLVGQLGKYSSFANGGKWSDAHPGFRNRRRIWKIMETIENIQSISPEATSRQAPELCATP